MLRNCICWIYLGSNNCIAASARGDSNTETIAIILARFWPLAQRSDVGVWFSRVRSEINPAYLPTREKTLPFRAKRRVSFQVVRNLYAECRPQLRKKGGRRSHLSPLGGMWNEIPEIGKERHLAINEAIGIVGFRFRLPSELSHCTEGGYAAGSWGLAP